MRDEVEAQKNVIRQQAAEEKRILDEKYNEMKLDYQDEKARADEQENKVRKIIFIIENMKFTKIFLQFKVHKLREHLKVILWSNSSLMPDKFKQSLLHV